MLSINPVTRIPQYHRATLWIQDVHAAHHEKLLGKEHIPRTHWNGFSRTHRLTETFGIAPGIQCMERLMDTWHNGVPKATTDNRIPGESSYHHAPLTPPSQPFENTEPKLRHFPSLDTVW